MKSAGLWAGAVVFLSVLLFWQITYSYSCLSLLWAAIVFAAICCGQFRAAMHLRRFRADYYFRPESWMHRWARGPVFAAFTSLATAVPATFLLLGFVATARLSDWAFLVVDAGLAMGLFLAIRTPVAKHATQGAARLIGKRFAVIGSFVMLALLYVPISYYFVSVPDYLVGNSLELSISNASRQIASVCPAINLPLKATQELQALLWFETRFGTGFIRELSVVAIALWGIFLLNSALVFLACSRGALEFATATERLVASVRNSKGKHND